MMDIDVQVFMMKKETMDRCECILCDVIISGDLIINIVYWSYYKYSLLTWGKLENPEHVSICFMLTAILVDVNTIISVVEMKT